MDRLTRHSQASRLSASRSFHRLLAAALAAPLVVLAGCSGNSEPGVKSDLMRAEGVQMRTVELSGADALDSVVEAAVAVGATTLQTAGGEDNLVVSPSSLVTALAMLADGAKGQTLTDLELMLGASGDQRRDAFAALQRAIGQHDGDPVLATGDELPDKPILHLASQVVIDDGFEVNKNYLEALADGYDAGAQHADLSSSAGKKVLDAWVNHHTGGLIEESAIEPSDDLRLVLQDAILFAGRWQYEFSALATWQQPFNLADGTQVDVETMSTIDASFSYAELSDGWVAVRMPYQDAAYADVLLPPQGTDPAQAMPSLLAEAKAKLNQNEPVEIAVSLPKVDIKDAAPLDLIGSGVFEQLGIASTLCTSGAADLSGIALAPGELCLEQAMQQAVLQIDEAGTVAAAVTELGVGVTSAPMPPANEVHFDRPFLFTINHDESGWPLFYAAIRDPRAAA
ncbi:Serpin (serine protease inhibitor) [Micrococcales bacterium KH10]|nr:Serpin (serine protease inhibitor) [Micrococcales bacterium KH10]